MEQTVSSSPQNIFAVFNGDAQGSFEHRFEKAFSALAAERELRASRGAELVWIRVFLSDIINQLPQISERLSQLSGNCAISIVEQPPLDGSKVSIMACFLTGGHASQTASDTWDITYRGTTYIYQAMRFDDATAQTTAGGHDQTAEAFERHKALLSTHGLTIKDNTLRTWLFCRDIDRTYAGIVKGRNDFFAQNGLTADTHFIASTGIGGYTPSSSAVVGVDFLSRNGSATGDVKYLQALDHLNPTAQYGVAFERGTAFSADTHRVSLISGTASIDKQGSCIYLNDPAAQTERLLDNTDALLADDGSSLSDIKMIIFYLRDAADYADVAHVARKKLPHDTAMVFVHAKVCRPAWLVEAECIAIR